MVEDSGRGILEQNITILSDQEDMIEKLTKVFFDADAEICACMESNTLIFSTDIESLTKAKLAAKKRGVTLRYLTEITEENLHYCKKQMEMVTELRHLDFVKGNFIVSDKEFLSVPVVPEDGPATNGICTDAHTILLQQQLTFETLWRKAKPAGERIRELEQQQHHSQQNQHLSSSRKSDQVAEVASAVENKKKIIIDRIYLCMKCGMSFVYRGEVLQHSVETGHNETRELPLGNSM